MKIDLNRSSEWQKLNLMLHSKLALDSKESCLVYKGLEHAIFETLCGLSLFLKHKRSVVFITGDSYCYDFIYPYFYKEGYDVQLIKRQDISSEDDFLEKIKSDTLFVAYVEDNPITGEVWDYLPLIKKINDKKIYTLGVSHSNYLFTSYKVEATSSRILSLSPELSVAIAGGRVVNPKLISHSMHWDSHLIERRVESLQLSHCSQYKETILKFESSDSVRFKPYFETSAHRNFDRAVIILNNLNAYAVLQKWSQISDERIYPPGAEFKLETPVKCRWGGEQNFEWWAGYPGDDELRGMLIISGELLSNPKFIHDLKLSIDYVRSLQS